jgi:hypothetical protein
MLGLAAAATAAVAVALFSAAPAGAVSFSPTPAVETAPEPRAVAITGRLPKYGPSVFVPSAERPEFWQFRLGAAGPLEVFTKYEQGVPGPSRAIGTADFDRDFADDLAIANTGTSGLLIVRCYPGVGLFVPQLDANGQPDPYPTGPRPVAVATGQLDPIADSRPDVATANDGDGTVTTWRNTGKFPIKFHDRADAKVGDNPRALVIGPFGGGGIFRDVAVAVAGEDRVVVLERRGRDLNEIASVEAGNQPSELVRGDFDEDQRLDLMVANPLGQLTLLVGKEGGGFEPAKRVFDGADVSAMATADFDRDGKADLALANPSAGRVTVLLGRGNGTAYQRLTYETGSRPAAIAAGDINGDGRPDLAVANLGSTTVTALLNRP